MTQIQFKFNERKAVQVASRLINQNGGEMNYLALMKLMYFVDREALLQFGRPVTGDKLVAMEHGMVLSRVFDLISQKKQEVPSSLWHQFIPRPARYVYTVRFAGVPETTELSEAELALVDEIFHKYRDIDEWSLVDLAHDLPEWKNPGKTSAPVSFEDVLRAARASEETIEAIAENAEVDAFMDKVLPQAV